MRARAGSERDVQLALQQAAEADVAGGMQHSVHDGCRGRENVESHCCKFLRHFSRFAMATRTAKNQRQSDKKGFLNIAAHNERIFLFHLSSSAPLVPSCFEAKMNNSAQKHIKSAPLWSDGKFLSRTNGKYDSRDERTGRIKETSMYFFRLQLKEVTLIAFKTVDEASP